MCQDRFDILPCITFANQGVIMAKQANRQQNNRRQQAGQRGPGRPRNTTSPNGPGNADTAGNRGSTGRAKKTMDQYADEDYGDSNGMSMDENYEELKQDARRIFGPEWDSNRSQDPRSAGSRFSNARQDTKYQSEYSDQGQRDRTDTNSEYSNQTNRSDQRGQTQVNQARNVDKDVVVETFIRARDEYINAREMLQDYLMDVD